MALPSWAPSLDQVAVHIPTRTRDVNSTTYSGGYVGTFTSATTPTDAQANEQIAQACTKVTSDVGTPVAAAADDQCQVAAAWWAAYYIELGYPERDADLKTYEQLRVEAEESTKAAAAVNEAAGGGSTLQPDPVAALMPTNSFPAAPRWADVTFW